MRSLLSFLFICLSMCAIAAPAIPPKMTGGDTKIKDASLQAVRDEAAETQSSSKHLMIIDPKLRAMDYQQAFELLRKEKTSGKVAFELANGKAISNIIDLTLMGNGTMILFRYNTPQGIQFQIVNLEDIVSLYPL
jgi:hypothetical protein